MRLLGVLAALAGALTLGASAPPAGVNLPLLLADAPAQTLADYGLFEGPGPTAPNAGVTPYSLNTPLFSDYATKARFVYMPPGTHAAYAKTGVLDFPVGTTLIKTFAFPADMRKPDKDVRVIETRLLIRKAAGWVANTYVWNADATSASLTRAGATVPVSFVDPSGHPRQINYAIPNVNQCKECHSLDGAVSPIGLKARNLNGDFTYASGAQNQLAYWSAHGLLTGAPAPAQAPRTAVWDDPHAPIADRGRAYLDANCGHCHNPAGFASNSGLYLDLEEQDPSAQGIDKRPIAAGRGSGGLLFAIAPGDPDHSILVYRMASTEPGVMMPQLGRSLTHDEGLAVVRAYIAAMKPAN